MRSLESETRLAGSARARERHETCGGRANERGHGCHVERSAYERLRRHRQRGPWPGCGLYAGVQRRVLAQDCRLEILQLPRGLHAQLVDEPCSCLPVCVQGVGLSARSVEREHHLRVQSLSIGVLRGEALELGDEVGCSAQLEVGVDAALECDEPELLEPLALGRHERSAFEAGECNTAAERERCMQLRRGDAGRLAARVVHERLEELEIELVPVDLEPVARALCDDAIVP